MSIQSILRAALRSLRRAPLRSGLTALGVIIGVAAVVATANIGAGARAMIDEALSRPESRTIHVGTLAQRRGADAAFPQLGRSDGLRPSDYTAIRASNPNISGASPRIFLSGIRAKANGRAADVQVEGIDVEGFAVFPRRLRAGFLFNENDVAQNGNVCVISESLARLLYAGELRVGGRVLVGYSTFIVVGVVDDVTSISLSAVGARDLHVYMPYTSLLQRVDRTAYMSIGVQASDMNRVRQIQQGIADLMEERRSGRRVEYVTSSSSDAIRAYADGSLAVARLLAAIGAIALIVGAIGIMNIMLVSVAERTREIGIRLALGTRSRDIRMQFLVEALTLSLTGGAIGVVLGGVASWLIGSLNGWQSQITVTSISSAVVCSLLVGVISGFHPAAQAAALHPTEALRRSD